MTISLSRLTTSKLIIAAPTQARQAVLRALAYSDIFDYAPSADELFATLEVPMTRTHFDTVLEALRTEGAIITAQERSMLAGREELAAIWQRRQAQSARKWQQARRYTSLIRRLPLVRMVAITGTLAVNSAEAGDDIDLFLITAPGRVWLARALTILVVRLAARAGVTLCPNYLLAADALEIGERNLYAARELAQMQPLYGAGWYHHLRASNRWMLGYLPNSETGPAALALPLDRLSIPARALKWLGEWLLGGRLGAALDRWEMRRKTPKLLKARTPIAPQEVEFSSAQCKGHFEGHASRILRLYDARVAALLGEGQE